MWHLKVSDVGETLILSSKLFYVSGARQVKYHLPDFVEI